MLTSLSINNFRGLKGLEIKPLGHINLLAGKNGSGKTSVLEALWLFSGPDSPELTMNAAITRGLSSITPQAAFLDLFNGFDPAKSIQIAGNVSGGPKRRSLNISLKEPSLEIVRSSPSQKPAVPLESSTQFLRESRFQIVFDYTHDDGQKYSSRGWWLEQIDSPAFSGPIPVEITNEAIYRDGDRLPGKPVSIFKVAAPRDNPQVEAQRFGALQLQGKADEILDVLRAIEPRLQSIVPIYVTNVPEMHANIEEDPPVSIRLLGGWIQSAFLNRCSHGLGPWWNAAHRRDRKRPAPHSLEGHLL